MLAYLVEIVILCYYQARLLDIGLVSTVALTAVALSDTRATDSLPSDGSPKSNAAASPERCASS